VLLLPHAWEGQGPDHSSGRLERFLQLAAEDNIRVANCTTAAQYFFLLRRQAHALRSREATRPLILMTPKSLLRHPLASSRSSDLVDGRFMPVLDDARAREQPRAVERLVFCSGHVWAELEADKRRAEHDTLAVVRIEELYPFPEAELRRILERYSAARSVIWLQEEPKNMGAWSFVESRLGALLDGRELRYIGRPERASPAEGWSDAHASEQRRIFSEILGQQREVAAHAR
jgi:2-oxoglutarate dehydrogenase E1 component